MDKVRSLDVDSLRTFLACCEAKSFAEAGDWVAKSQSAVSMQMRALSQAVGQPLFEKDGRRNVLTVAGRELREYAQRMVRLNDEAVGRFRPEGPAGLLRIGTPEDYAEAFLPQVFGRFAHEFPRVEVVIDSRSSSGLAKAVAAGELDLAVVTVEPWMSGIEIVMRETLVWSAPPDRRLEEERPLPLALWQPGCIWREMALATLDGAGIEARPAFTGSSAATLVMAVAAGLAVSALPRRYCGRGLRAVPDGVLPPPGGFDVGLMRSETRPKALADTFAERVKEAFARIARAGPIDVAA